MKTKQILEKKHWRANVFEIGIKVLYRRQAVLPLSSNLRMRLSVVYQAPCYEYVRCASFNHQTRHRQWIVDVIRFFYYFGCGIDNNSTAETNVTFAKLPTGKFISIVVLVKFVAHKSNRTQSFNFLRQSSDRYLRMLIIF